MPYLLRDLVLTQEVSQIYRFTATPHLGFRWQCVFCTFCNVSISTVKSPAEMTSSCSESEGACNGFFTSLFTEATRSTIQALAHGTAHTIILLCSLLSSMMCVSYRLNPNDVHSVLLLKHGVLSVQQCKHMVLQLLLCHMGMRRALFLSR